MDKKIAGLVGAVSALVAPEGLQALPAAAPNAKEILRVESYAQLLDPIPNALELLKAVDAEPREPLPVQQVQFYYHHHHHHHHHHGYWGGPYYRPYYHHHHHHHHGPYYNPYPYPYYRY